MKKAYFVMACLVASGYMTAWAITQTTRFKAAMVGAGIINLVSMYATNDMPNYLAGFFRGVPGAANLETTNATGSPNTWNDGDRPASSLL